MNLRWLGLTLLLTSFIIGALIAWKPTTFVRTEDYVRAIDKEGQISPAIDRVVAVPPWNSTTEGWVGFDILLQQEKVNYEAWGIVMPNDNAATPDVAMRVVNVTGLGQLVFDQFDPATWKNITLYAAADLYPPNNLYARFVFRDLDDPNAKYTVLFRNYKNATEYVLVNIKEAWYEPTTVSFLEPSPPLIVISGLTAVTGVGLVIKKQKPPRKRSVQKRSFSR